MPPKEQKNPLGPTGWMVARNVRELREARGMTYKDLSDKLSALERPIPVLGLSRLEKGERRVDADDLMALALALRVNVSALMLPRMTGDTFEERVVDEIQLTPSTYQRFSIVWDWADGRFPLPPEPVEPTVLVVTASSEEWDDFQHHARPSNMQIEWHPALKAVNELALRINLLIAEHGPASLDRRIAGLTRALRRAAVEIESLIIENDPDHDTTDVLVAILRSDEKEDE